mmetsp:Transcript_23889/g.56920  ORF Transcript_23889/g.56920 Transcript_23889/m.56920 type:complete len:388 (+) Transcript_23889:207-1370(+)
MMGGEALLLGPDELAVGAGDRWQEDPLLGEGHRGADAGKHAGRQLHAEHPHGGVLEAVRPALPLGRQGALEAHARVVEDAVAVQQRLLEAPPVAAALAQLRRRQRGAVRLAGLEAEGLGAVHDGLDGVAQDREHLRLARARRVRLERAHRRRDGRVLPHGVVRLADVPDRVADLADRGGGLRGPQARRPVHGGRGVEEPRPLVVRAARREEPHLEKGEARQLLHPLDLPQAAARARDILPVHLKGVACSEDDERVLELRSCDLKRFRGEPRELVARVLREAQEAHDDGEESADDHHEDAVHAVQELVGVLVQVEQEEVEGGHREEVRVVVERPHVVPGAEHHAAHREGPDDGEVEELARAPAAGLGDEEVVDVEHAHGPEAADGRPQ